MFYHCALWSMTFYEGGFCQDFSKTSYFLGLSDLFGTLNRRKAYTFGVVLGVGTALARFRTGSSTEYQDSHIGLH